MSVKSILIKPISSKDANELCKKFHYSGKVVPNSQIHFGVFYNGGCHGVMQFGPSLAKKLTMKLVNGTKFNDFIELNRMAFGPALPKNSESRALSVAHKIIKKNYPNIQWIVSFADATQCGDGTIYRASGYKLTQIKKNTSMWINKKTGVKMQDMQFYHTMTKRDASWSRLEGYMLRYVYFLDKTCEKNLSCEVIPYTKIKELGVGMYKGVKCASSKDNVVSGFQSEEGGVIPTDALQLGVTASE